MDLARSISNLLTWQWVALILGIAFSAPLRRLIDRLIHLSVGGRKGIQLSTARHLTESEGRIKPIENAPTSTAPVTKRVEAEHFVLRDRNGKIRAVLTTNDTNGTILGLFDAEQNQRAGLFVAENGDSGLIFYDGAKKGRVVLGYNSGEDGVLLIAGPDGKVAAALTVDKNGVPTFEGGQNN
jgi:hypothetical protein